MKIPVTRGFDKTDVIGFLTLRDDVDIPLDSVFALAYTKQPDGTSKVQEVSLIPDSNYLQYLKDEKNQPS